MTIKQKLTDCVNVFVLHSIKQNYHDRLLTVCFWKIYYDIIFDEPTLSGASIDSTSEVYNAGTLVERAHEIYAGELRQRLSE
jgi:hypothetical protein